MSYADMIPVHVYRQGGDIPMYPLSWLHLLYECSDRYCQNLRNIMSTRSSHRSSTQLQYLSDKPALEAKLLPSSTLYLDDQSTHLISQHAKKTKSVGRIQRHRLRENKSVKPSNSLLSSSKPSAIEPRNLREPIINRHTHPYSKGNEVILGTEYPQQKNKVCIKLPTVPVITRAWSGLSKDQPSENLLNTPIESIIRLQTDSSDDDAFETRQLVHGKLSFSGIDPLFSQSKDQPVCGSSRKTKDNFYPAITDAASDTMVKHIQIAWQTSLENRYLHNTGAVEDMVNRSNPNIPISRHDTCILSAEKLFMRKDRGTSEKYRGHCQQENDSRRKALVGTESCMHLIVSAVDRHSENARSLSAPGDYCGHYKLSGDAHSRMHEHKEHACSSSTSTFSLYTPLQRPHTNLDKTQHMLNNHIELLKEPRKRAIRALLGSLPVVPKTISPLSKTISAPTQQATSATSQMYVQIDGQQIPILYSADDSPFVSKLRNNFSYTDLTFTFDAHAHSNVSSRAVNKVDANIHKQVQQTQEKVTEIDVRRLEQSPPRQQADDRVIRAQKRNMLISNVCSIPLSASPTKNLFCSPINFSTIDSEEDYIYNYDVSNNLSVGQTNLKDTLASERRENVLKNDTLKGIATSLKDLEVLQNTRKSSRCLVNAQPNNNVESPHGNREPTAEIASSHPLCSPKKHMIERSTFEKTLQLRDLTIQSTEIESKRNHKPQATINSVSSALPQTAKSARFFTFNV